MASRTFVGGVGLFVVASLGGVAALRGRTTMDTEAEPGPQSHPAQVERHPLPVRAEQGWLGVVIAAESVDLATRFEGRVESVRVQVGSVVKQGEVMATLDAKSARQELAVAEAELVSSRAEHQLTTLAWDEARERLNRRDVPEQLRTGAISEEELSTARYQERMAAAKQEVARAQILEREARVTQLRQRVEESSIRAPFEGVVASRFTHPGALLQPGQPLLHLLRKGDMQVRFAVPSAQARQVVLGRPVVLEVAEQAGPLRGQVTQVAPEVDVASLRVFAIAEVDVPDGVMVPAGTVARVKLASDETHAGMMPAAESTGAGNP